MPQLFEGVAWGTGSVLQTSIAIARARGMEPALLPELSDVDEPADLEVWHEASRASRTVSVIIPTLNEAEHLETTLKQVTADRSVEVIVADGGCRDETLHIASAYGAMLVKSPAGRARQMNAGAAVASGEVLLFLHADTLLPVGYRDLVLTAVCQPAVVGGAFGFRIRDAFPGRWLVEWTTRLRSRLLRAPYGDQALFVRRWVFEHLGGFPDLPLMEDYEFVRRLRRLGRITLLDAPVLTSGRRWSRLGFVRATLINKLVILGYRFGVPPERLAALYRGTRSVSEQGWRQSSGAGIVTASQQGRGINTRTRLSNTMLSGVLGGNLARRDRRDSLD